MTAEPEEAYVAIDRAVLEAIREFAWVAEYDRHTLPAVRLMLRVAAIDSRDGRLVVGVKLVRDLQEGEAEHGFGSI